MDGVPRFTIGHSHDDVPGVGSYNTQDHNTIAASVAAAKNTGRHRRRTSPHKAVKPSRATAFLGRNTDGALAPHTVAHSPIGNLAKPKGKQRCTFNG